MYFSYLFKCHRSTTMVLSKVEFSLTCSSEREFAKNLKGKSKSSQEWLLRQLADPYVERAKMENYRCRSAFKLIEMDKQLNFLKPGQSAIDCGAAPGSWTQVLVLRTNALGKDINCNVGRVIAVDRLPIYPIEGATILSNMDFTLEATQTKVLNILSQEKVDIVVSDMAPNATGVRCLDHESIITLAYSALRFAVQVSKPGASCLLKVWDGGLSRTLENDLNRFYDWVKVIKPAASRTDSAEKFLFATGFKGLKTFST